MPLIRVRRAAWTGVRAPVVARKRGNARGAKGCRKVEEEVSIGQNQSQCECREAKQTGDSPSSARKGDTVHCETPPVDDPCTFREKAVVSCIPETEPYRFFGHASSILFEVKPPTGEPDAGDPPVRFGGRGDRNQSALPTPIGYLKETKLTETTQYLSMIRPPWMPACAGRTNFDTVSTGGEGWVIFGTGQLSATLRFSPLFQRKGQINNSPFSESTLQSDLSTVFFDDALGDGESQPDPLLFG